VTLDGQAASDRDRIIEAVDGVMRARGIEARELPSQPQGLPEFEYPAVLIFIDEVHLVPRRSQEGLLTLTDPEKRFVRLSDRICRFPKATYIAATTRPQEIDSALTTRFRPEVRLDDYTEDEIATMVGIRFPDIPPDVRLALARFGQLVPRVALRLAADLTRRRHVSLNREKTWEDHLGDLRRADRLDPQGLGRLHYAVLEILASQRRPIGLDQLLNLTGEVDRQRVEQEVLTGLQRMGMVEVRSNGRVITDKGRNYLRTNTRP
jgi:Holliday junction resolvasome RuvABC ATP-dependent DNA helicase subunit